MTERLLKCTPFSPNRRAPPTLVNLGVGEWTPLCNLRVGTKQGQSGGFPLTRCQFPNPGLDLLPLTKRRSHLPTSQPHSNTANQRLDISSREAKQGGLHWTLPPRAPRTVPRGQRPNPEVWRKIKTSAGAFPSEGKLSFNSTSFLQLMPAGIGCPRPEEVFCQHPSDPHQI